MKRLTLLVGLLVVATVPALAEWTVWEDFDRIAWEPEKWPLTENSQITWDVSRALSGRGSLAITIDCKGWGGALKARSAPLLSKPTEGMSVSVFCEPQPGATGIPAAKLEVYALNGGQTMGGPDTALKAGQWTTIPLPAAQITDVSQGIGIIFLKADSSGPFKLWVDSLLRDGKAIDDFECAGAIPTWSPANINGANQWTTVDPTFKDMPSLEQGHATRLQWSEDSDGVELKALFDQPFDISTWKKIQFRVANQKTSDTPPKVSLWLFDGEKGSLAMGSPVPANGQWSEIVFDLESHRNVVRFQNIKEIAVVVNGYSGNAGDFLVDRISYEK